MMDMTEPIEQDGATMNWKDELAEDLAALRRDSMLEQIPKFVRGHRVATLGTKQADGSYVNEAVPVDQLEDAEVMTSWTGEREEPKTPAGPNDWSALIHQPETFHRPVLDLDFDAALVPSTSADHHHLYLDKVLTWTQYVKLLDVLAEVGIIEPGYRDASIAREFTSVRLPWITKSDTPKPRGWTQEGRDAITAEMLAEYRAGHDPEVQS